MRWTSGAGVVLFAASLLLRSLTALPLRQPGYMDAYYYFNVADRLFRGLGFSDPYLWNFLDNPSGIPYPACLYWMPLTSILIYPFFLVFGPSFRAAQVPFVLLSALLPLLAFRLALDLGGRVWQAYLAAGLLLFSGFYVPYWVAPDNFTPFAAAAGLSLYCAGKGLQGRTWPWFAAAGALAGLAHLARADGVLVVVVVALTALALAAEHRSPLRTAGQAVGIAVASYACVMSPWFYRNVQIVGAPLSGAGAKALFLRSYDELYSYSRPLNLYTYLDWGWSAILGSKLEGLGFGALNLFAVNWMVFLAPLVVWGVWILRRRVEVWPVLSYGVMSYAVLALGFTYPGIRGGLFHTSGALLPWFFVAAALGLDAFVAYVAARRATWRPAQARVVLGVGIMALAVGLSGLAYSRAALGTGPNPGWNERDAAYAEVDRRLASFATPDERLMVNNVPAYWYHTGRECISIPNEPPDVVLQAAQRYGVAYLLLERDHPQPMDGLYDGTESSPGFQRISEFAGPEGDPLVLFRLGASK